MKGLPLYFGKELRQNLVLVIQETHDFPLLIRLFVPQWNNPNRSSWRYIRVSVSMRRKGEKAGNQKTASSRRIKKEKRKRETDYQWEDSLPTQDRENVDEDTLEVTKSMKAMIRYQTPKRQRILKLTVHALIGLDSNDNFIGPPLFFSSPLPPR